MVLSLSCRRLHSLIRNSNYRHYSGGYVVLLPEIGPSLPDQPNPLLKDGLPNFEDITPEKCAHTLGKSLLDFEHEVFAVEARLKEAEQQVQKEEEYSNGFIQKVVQPLQKPGIALDTSWGIVKTVFIVDGEKLQSSSYLKLHSRAHRAQYSRYCSREIYKASKECDLTQLSEEEQRVVERYQLEGHLNGLGLPKDDKEAFDNLSKRLYSEKCDFNKRIQLCKGLFDTKISDQYVVKNFPIRLLESTAEDSNEPTIGPWLVPMDTYNFNKFLEYCPDANLRLKVWENKMSVASFELDVSELHNSVSLEKIRDIRLHQATLLGYPNYATMSMETKMGGTLENVLNVLELLRTFAFEAHKEEIDTLQEFAVSSGFNQTLYIPDIPYWSRKQKKVLFNFENEEVREYFPFDKVVSGLIAFCEKMFGVRFELVQNADTWHSDVKFYHIFEGDSVGPVASFFFDPFSRPEKLKCDPEEGWVVNIHPACQTNSPRSVPVCSLIMNLPPPIYGKPSLLSYSEVQGLFGKFGKVLQQLLCTVVYSEVSGSSYIEWDAVDIVSHFMVYCLEDPKVLETVSGHYSSGEKLPVTNMRDVSAHMAGTALSSQLYKSVLDLKLYSEKKFWPDIVKALWPQHFVFPLDERRNQEPVSMTEIVTEQWAAGYFSHVWSKMIAADIYTAFQDDNADEVAIGSRFRDTYLAFGGSCDPHEVFRRFRGRDPNPDSFLRHLRLRK